jgi:RimJ/RimL family protein N-acetyltransferase
LNNKVKIKETTIDDLNNVVSLWNDGNVMQFVGFPNGLGVTRESLEKNWLQNINTSDKRRHYSIYHEDLGYCGESYYGIEANGKAALDIKLFFKSRGKGIAYMGLKYAIEKAFTQGKATSVYVDPQKINSKALKLYSKFNFKEYPHPDSSVAEKHLYLELSKEDYETHLNQ